MRSPEEIKNLVLEYAKYDDRIRAVILNGSRANDKIEPDIYQDYDVVFFVRRIHSFTSNHDWTNFMGKKILWQLPDEMTLGLEENRDLFTYLMVFKDGNRIDLTLYPVK